jgi:hypothetical protein
MIEVGDSDRLNDELADMAAKLELALHGADTRFLTELDDNVRVPRLITWLLASCSKFCWFWRCLA